MNVDAVFWMIKPLPEKNWGKNLDAIVIGTIIAVFLVVCLVRLIRSYMRNRYCACCRSKTVLGMRTEKRSASTGFKRFGGKWHFGRTYGTAAIVVLRCPKCGFEIELGK